MKVLFLSHKYPPSVGGMEKQSFELIQQIKKNAEVVVIAYDASKESKVVFFLRLRSRVKQALRDHPDIDVIHLNDGLMVTFSLWLKGLTNIPVTATFHGLDIRFPFYPYQKWIIPRFAYLHRLICVSSYTAKMLKDIGLPEHKICVIQNGVDHNLKQIGSLKKARKSKKMNLNLDDKKVMLMVGRPVRRKGMSWFLDNVLRQLPEDFHLLIAGSFDHEMEVQSERNILLPSYFQKMYDLFRGYPDDRLKIQKLAKDEDLYHKVTLLPRLTDEELDQMYRMSDLFIMPNINVHGDMEGFGLVALEASMRGLPVLSSGIEGIRDAIVDGSNGFYANSEDASNWIHRIYELFEDPIRLIAYGQTFKDFTCKHYSWKKMGEAYLYQFQRLSNQAVISKSYIGGINHAFKPALKLEL